MANIKRRRPAKFLSSPSNARPHDSPGGVRNCIIVFFSVLETNLLVERRKGEELEMSDSLIPTRVLGRQGLIVSALGLGCMGMSQSYGPAHEQESIATIHRAIGLGMF